MRVLVFSLVVFSCVVVKAGGQEQIKALALSSGFKVSDRIVEAIVEASETFDIDPLILTVIGILESGLGSNLKTRMNTNGTEDHGIFQINSVNIVKCRAFRLDTVEGNAFCAAKLLSQIKIRRPSDVAKYHSKTKSKKENYFRKMTQVLRIASDKK